MTREWKPGDVAWLDVRTGGAVGVWTGEFWAWSDGSGPYEGVSHAHLSVPARPLVVIDPEDREQVERLLAHYHGWKWEAMVRDSTAHTADMQAALREFANPTPPKPSEPTGLGAVVEDAEGFQWVRIGDRDWYCEARGNKFFDRIDAVKVLSEGVQP